jgi:phospholipase D1/2
MHKVALVKVEARGPARERTLDVTPPPAPAPHRTAAPQPRAAVASPLYLFGDAEARPVKPQSATSWQRRLKLFAPLVLVLAVVAAWYFGDLARLTSPEKIAGLARELRQDPWAAAYVIAAFSLGSLLFFPITALQTATVLLFDPVQAFLYAYAASLCAAIVTYWGGRLLGSEVLAYVRGPKISKLQEALRRHAIRASIAARLLPVGNFTLINMMTGSMHVPFGSYVLGNMVGVLPGLVLLTLFADQLTKALWTADATRLIAIGAGVLVVGGTWFYMRRRARRRGAQASSAQ